MVTQVRPGSLKYMQVYANAGIMLPLRGLSASTRAPMRSTHATPMITASALVSWNSRRPDARRKHTHTEGRER
eukprot:6199165-Pleurochrysis_carterae.AAC.2